MIAERLNEIDVRVLGSLIEKEATTPDYYPLSLNALKLACNQSSNREPVMQLDDGAVLAATDRLRRKSLVRALQKADARVMKYSHLMGETMELDKRELAVMCVLMLRGPQTLAEIRTRTERLADFGQADAVEQAIQALSAPGKALVTRIARKPGQKEDRFAHLLSGDVTSGDVTHDAAVAPQANAPQASTPAEGTDRMVRLESDIADLRRDVADLRSQLAEFRRQFE
jgi:uncharacterized protein YceH (UPF0502 family)